jgi:hypothetical protein
MLVRAAAAAAVVLALAVIGVVVFRTVGGDDDSLSPTAPSTTAGEARSSQSSQSSSAVPTLSEDGGQRSPEGAAAFATYWFQLLDYATRTGDVSKLEELSSPACADCRRVATTIKRGYAGGGKLQGGSYTVRTANSGGISGNEDPPIDVVFDRSPRSAIGPNGEARGSLQGASFVVCRVLLQWKNGWKILTLTSADPIA